MKFINFLKTHYISVIGVIILSAILISGGMRACETAEFNQTVTTQTSQANKAVKEAVNADNAAINADIERRTEDAAREKIIKPKLDTARRRSENSKAALEAARKNQDAQKNNTANLSDSVADNCAELARLYPGTEFEYCPER